MRFESHHHDFNKIVIMISEKASYYIEAKPYNFQPFFNLAAGEGNSLLRPDKESQLMIKNLLLQLEEACKTSGFGSQVLKNSVFMQFIVQLNRLFIRSDNHREPGGTILNRSIDGTVKYINEHLTEDLSIKTLSEYFFMSRYYLMHSFKTCTGYSIHNFILQKRLIMANSLIKQGKPAAMASLECGFGDYSSFVKAFKKMFILSPKQHYKNMQQLQKSYEEGLHMIE